MFTNNKREHLDLPTSRRNQSKVYKYVLTNIGLTMRLKKL